MQSVRTYQPGAARFIILADTYRTFPTLDSAAELVFCEDLGIPLLANMALWYTVIEFNTAIKPFVCRWLFDAHRFEEVVYLDPDILLFRPLSLVFDGLTAHNIVLIPHTMAPLRDGKEPSDLSIMKSGVYNLGFLGVRNDPEARALIDWWADRCTRHCRVDIPGHMFTDQRWMDLAPAFVPKPLILRHPGYNVAYWNLAHREVCQAPDGSWQVNGEPLVFFHFSGFDPLNPTQFSKHQNRFTVDTLGPVAALCEAYRRRLLSNGWAELSRIRYGFATFPDGRPIEDAMRHWFRRAVDEGRVQGNVPVAVGSDYFDQPDEEMATKGVTLTRFMYQYWFDRADLRAAFDVSTPQGCQAYTDWFVDGEAHRQGVDGRSVAAARRISGRPDAEAVQIVRCDTLPPWPAVSRRAWQGPSRGVARFFEGDVTATFGTVRIPVPVQIALMWELRADLQFHFTLEAVDGLYSFLAWALTSGVAEGNVDPAEFSEPFVRHMAEILPVSAHFQELPITRGLVATRFVASPHPGYEARRRFPVARASRLAHGLWYAFIAAKRFRWPLGLVAPLVAWFQSGGAVTYDGFALPNAALAIWELRLDVQLLYPLGTEDSVGGYLVWLLSHGLNEMDLSLEHLGESFRDFLAAKSPRWPGVERICAIVHGLRSDLRDAFNLATPSGQEAFDNWRANHAADPVIEPVTAIILSPPAAVEAPVAPPVHKAAVALTGQWFAPTGRGEDIRCSAASLRQAGFSDFLIVDLPSGAVLTPDGRALPERVRVEVNVNVVHCNADTAYSDWRRLRGLGISAELNVGFWAWELEHLPSYWRHAFSFYDEVWASTRFARKAFRHEKLRPIRLMPMAVTTPESWREVSRRELGLPADAMLFVCIFDFRSHATRKNPEAVVQAFLRAFPGDETAYLVIKTMGAEGNCGRLAQLAELCRDPRILIRDIELDREELIGLIKASDAFVSLHRSEGFGRGPSEAMLLGKPTILTAYSGTIDFTNEECAYLIKYKLVPVAPHEYVGVEGQRWANPDIATAGRVMRRVYEDPREARRVGQLGRARVSRLLSPKVVGVRMCDALKELVSTSSQDPRRMRGSNGRVAGVLEDADVTEFVGAH
jgi:glycosyltransferase involved in cell wall biosynthesis